ncbi:hypothetical protein AXF42_Ash001034 [Apostasia shenzhenica]|uniref:Uncharacterized protein n=1 Tax=Apostasia shenzhenica TaxID=1088818 RepID=A0A2I0ATR9_9ASPA|nr:hypothetical protein AXF42_Ash001034 [Apostasia shenzhenica]
MKMMKLSARIAVLLLLVAMAVVSANEGNYYGADHEGIAPSPAMESGAAGSLRGLGAVAAVASLMTLLCALFAY